MPFELVTACQETSTIRHLIKAGDLSKQLRRVKEDILNKVMLASFAINTHTTIVLLTFQAGGQPPLRQAQDAGVETSHSNQSTDDTSCRSDMIEVENNVLAGCSTLLVALREFRLSELKHATNGFSDGNIIGRGGSCIVYKGVLKDGTIVAIKKSACEEYEMWRHNFDQLTLIFSKLQHKNIAKFIGYSHQVMFTSLVQLFKRKKDRAKESAFFWVEGYVPNGSLEMIIRRSQVRQLDWCSLFRIIEGVAQGIDYLHGQRVIHRDLKPNNILLDSDMNPIITDFNLSAALDDNDNMTTVNSPIAWPRPGEMITRSTFAGTLGYIDPSYLLCNTLSTKNDVYGFGITLLVTVGSIRRQYRHASACDALDGWAWKAWKAGRIEEEFDPSLFDETQMTEIKRCVEVGLLCAQFDMEDRPTMGDVLEILHGERELPVPKMPSWWLQDEVHGGSSSPSHWSDSNGLEDNFHGSSSSPAHWSDSDGCISPR